MQPNSSLTTPQREQLVDLFETGFGYVAAANRLGFSVDASKQFHRKWMLHGRLCLMQSKTKSTFSFEIKKEVVERFLAGATKMELAAEFKLRSVQVVTRWTREWRAGGDEAGGGRPWWHLVEHDSKQLPHLCLWPCALQIWPVGKESCLKVNGL